MSENFGRYIMLLAFCLAIVVTKICFYRLIAYFKDVFFFVITHIKYVRKAHNSPY